MARKSKKSRKSDSAAIRWLKELDANINRGMSSPPTIRKPPQAIIERMMEGAEPPGLRHAQNRRQQATHDRDWLKGYETDSDEHMYEVLRGYTEEPARERSLMDDFRNRAESDAMGEPEGLDTAAMPQELAELNFERRLRGLGPVSPEAVSRMIKSQKLDRGGRTVRGPEHYQSVRDDDMRRRGYNPGDPDDVQSYRRGLPSNTGGWRGGREDREWAPASDVGGDDLYGLLRTQGLLPQTQAPGGQTPGGQTPGGQAPVEQRIGMPPVGSRAGWTRDQDWGMSDRYDSPRQLTAHMDDGTVAPGFQIVQDRRGLGPGYQAPVPSELQALRAAPQQQALGGLVNRNFGGMEQYGREVVPQPHLNFHGPDRMAQRQGDGAGSDAYHTSQMNAPGHSWDQAQSRMAMQARGGQDFARASGQSYPAMLGRQAGILPHTPDRAERYVDRALG